MWKIDRRMSVKRIEANQQFTKKGGKPATKIVSRGPGSTVFDASVRVGKFFMFGFY
jgi:hypothetical protein